MVTQGLYLFNLIDQSFLQYVLHWFIYKYSIDQIFERHMAHI